MPEPECDAFGPFGPISAHSAATRVTALPRVRAALLTKPAIAARPGRREPACARRVVERLLHSRRAWTS
jgi:hypothetical protein